jgi:hypothetical protein
MDMQLVVPRATELSAAHNKPESQQQQFAMQLNRRIEQEERSVTQTNKSESETVDKDGSNKGGGGGKKKKDNKKGGEKELHPVDRYVKSGLLDIRG